jgi:hypothetical protein
LNLNLRFSFARFGSGFEQVRTPEPHIIDSYRCVTLKVSHILIVLILVPVAGRIFGSIQWTMAERASS